MEGVIALLIPIIGIIIGNAMVVAVVYFIVQYHSKRKKYEHEERMLAIDKGADIPMTPPKEKNPYIWPFVFIGAGIATTIGGIAYQEGVWVFGLVLMLIGAGMLTARLLLAKQKKAKEENSISTEKDKKGGTLNEI